MIMASEQVFARTGRRNLGQPAVTYCWALFHLRVARRTYWRRLPPPRREGAGWSRSASTGSKGEALGALCDHLFGRGPSDDQHRSSSKFTSLWRTESARVIEQTLFARRRAKMSGAGFRPASAFEARRCSSIRGRRHQSMTTATWARAIAFRWMPKRGNSDPQAQRGPDILYFSSPINSGVARGFPSPRTESQHVHDWMRAENSRRKGAVIDDIRYCPHHPDGSVAGYPLKDHHTGEKPSPGMIHDLSGRTGPVRRRRQLCHRRPTERYRGGRGPQALPGLSVCGAA